jgi:hypothetical protein
MGHMKRKPTTVSADGIHDGIPNGLGKVKPPSRYVGRTDNATGVYTLERNAELVKQEHETLTREGESALIVRI